MASTTMEVTATVDSKKQITESNEANNQCKLTITVALAPGTMGISKIGLSPSKFSQSFEPPLNDAPAFPKYYDQPDPGQYQVVATFKNVGPGMSVAMSASGVAAGPYKSMPGCGSDYCKDLDPKPVPVLSPGGTYQVTWDLGNLAAHQLAQIVVHLKSP